MSQNKWAFFSNTTNSCLNYIEIGDISIAGNKLTVEASFKMIPNNSNCTPSGYHDIVSKHYDNSDVNYLLRPDHAELNTINGFYITNPVSITADDCHHVAMVYDGAHLKFFLDSCFVDSVAVVGNLITNLLATKVGYSAGLNPNWFTQFWGYIDEVRIWSIARTESELKQFAFVNLKDPATLKGLSAYYDFQNGFKNLLGNNAFDGILVGDVQLNTLENECIKLDESEPENPEGNYVLIKPNPVTEQLYINFGDSYTQVRKIKLFNVLGQVIYETLNIDSITEINMKSFITGVYFVSVIYNDNSILTEKIVKFDLRN